MNTLRLLPLAAGSLLGLPGVSAAQVTEPPRVYGIAYTLADYENPPQSFLLNITDSAITSLTRVEVNLQLSGVTSGDGFAGEMYVALNKDLSLTSVLANRVGVSLSDAVGSAYDGWNVTFADDAASGDVHTTSLISGVLSGTWQPDGRTFPTDVARPALLGVFNGEVGNGAWRLNVADLDLGGSMRLTGWSVTLTGEAPEGSAVPEASTWVAVGFLALVAGANIVRRTLRNG